MAQAETIPTTSRRNFLAAAAVVGAIAAPKVAVAETAHPDAELIELGKKLSKLTQEYYSEVARLAPLWDERARRMEAWRESHPNRLGSEDTAAYLRFGAECGINENNGNHPDDIMERIDPVANAIMAIPATTWEGVIVKAQLARFGADNYWDQSEVDTNWDQLLMRKLCDAVIDMAAKTAAGIAAS